MPIERIRRVELPKSSVEELNSKIDLLIRRGVPSINQAMGIDIDMSFSGVKGFTFDGQVVFFPGAAKGLTPEQRHDMEVLDKELSRKLRSLLKQGGMIPENYLVKVEVKKTPEQGEIEKLTTELVEKLGVFGFVILPDGQVKLIEDVEKLNERALPEDRFNKQLSMEDASKIAVEYSKLLQEQVKRGGIITRYLDIIGMPVNFSED